MFYLIIIIAVAFDQISKWYIQNNMDVYQTISIIEDFFNITYIHNTGAAFSILEGKTSFLIGMQIIVLTAMFIYVNVKNNQINRILKISLAFIVGGGIGNLIDRITNGYVVDFFDFHFWPIFNVADICVCVGCGLLMIYVFFIEGKVKNEQ